MPMRAQHADHRGVLRLDRLLIDGARQRLEEAHVVRRQRSPSPRIRIDVSTRPCGRLASAEGVGPDPLHVLDDLGQRDLPGHDRSQRHVHIERDRTHHGAVLDRRWLLAGRNEEIAAAVAPVLSGHTDVGQRHHPSVDRAAAEADTGSGRRNFEDRGAVPEIQHHADEGRFVVGQELVTRQRRLSQVDDVVVPGAEIAESGLAQTGETHRGHSPDRGLDTALVRQLIGEILIQAATLLEPVLAERSRHWGSRHSRGVRRPRPVPHDAPRRSGLPGGSLRPRACAGMPTPQPPAPVRRLRAGDVR